MTAAAALEALPEATEQLLADADDLLAAEGDVEAERAARRRLQATIGRVAPIAVAASSSIRDARREALDAETKAKASAATKEQHRRRAAARKPKATR